MSMSSMPGMDMPGMDMSGGSMSGSSGSGNSSSMSMMEMMVVFASSMTTPLYSMAWTPNSTGAYAATCVFLIVLGSLFRGLLALKAWQESRWLDAELARRFVVVNGKGPLAEHLSHDSLAKTAHLTLTERGVVEDVVVVQRPTRQSKPWRMSVDPVRAAVDTVIAGVGYLLMLAVMTMNVGYFASVLGGTFMGSLLVGRYVTSSEH